eukprot:scaffold9250_cov105-Isochrysis_galbana.AAC.10
MDTTQRSASAGSRTPVYEPQGVSTMHSSAGSRLSASSRSKCTRRSDCRTKVRRSAVLSRMAVCSARVRGVSRSTVTMVGGSRGAVFTRDLFLGNNSHLSPR